MTRYVFRACAVVFAMSLSTGVALAQHPLLRGMIVDPTRAPLADALVTAVDTAKKTVFKAHTDNGGEFAFQGLSAGILYIVIVRKPGFVTTGTRATLHAADTLDLDVMLAKDTTTAVASSSGRPVLRGTVADSTRAPLASAWVTVVDSATNAVISEVRTDSAGQFTVDRLSAGVPYLIAVRRVGLMEETSRATLHPGDTLNLQFVLAHIPVLAPVHVTAKADLEYHGIDADDIAKTNRSLHDAYDVVLQLRPLMFGDPYKGCMEDTSQFTFGAPRIDTSVAGRKIAEMERKAQDPRKFTLGVGSWALGLFKNGGAQISRKNRDSTSDAPPPVDSSHPFNLYINGVWHGAPGAKNILSQIPVDDIQEMHYIDCLDTTTPQYRNSLMVTLKPGKSY